MEIIYRNLNYLSLNHFHFFINKELSRLSDPRWHFLTVGSDVQIC